MKLLLRVALVALVLLLLAVVAAGFFADGIARSAVERGGTYAMGVETTLDAADVGLLSGSFGLAGLSVANPEGFSGQQFFTLRQGGLEVPLGDLLSDEIHVSELALEGVFVELERKGGDTNYGKILEHLEGLSKEEPAPEEEPPGGGPRLVFDRIVIRDVEARVSLIPLAGQMTRIPVYIEEFVLTDVGADGSGVSVAQVFDQVLRALLYTVIRTAGDVLPADLIQDLGGRIGDVGGLAVHVTGQVTAELGGKAVQLGSQIGEIGGALGGVLGEKAGGAVQGVGEAAKGLGGILGGGKKQDPEPSPSPPDEPEQP